MSQTYPTFDRPLVVLHVDDENRLVEYEEKPTLAYTVSMGVYALEPRAVAFPRNAGEVAAAVQVCARLGVPIVPRGGGTSLGGQAAGGRGLVLDLSRHMNALAIEDGTARVQTINHRQNAQYYDLLKAFQRRTQVPVLVNTSFNTRGEPIVCTPRDAVECFWTSPLDALAIGPFLLEKPGAAS